MISFMKFLKIGYIIWGKSRILDNTMSISLCRRGFFYEFWTSKTNDFIYNRTFKIIY